MSEYSERKAVLRPHGICVACGKRDADRGFLSCSDCRFRARRYWAKRMQRRRTVGLCTRCEQPAVPGGRLCQAHRDYFRDLKRRAARPAEEQQP